MPVTQNCTSTFRLTLSTAETLVETLGSDHSVSGDDNSVAPVTYDR